jgi:hypothetical protein
VASAVARRFKVANALPVIEASKLGDEAGGLKVLGKASCW